MNIFISMNDLDNFQKKNDENDEISNDKSKITIFLNFDNFNF